MGKAGNHESANCVEAVDLTHRFPRGEAALTSVNLAVAEGSIFGFLGPNGAGKSTTLKLILGLLRKQRGEIRVFGKRLESNRVELLRRTGAMIESPSVYGHLNAVENLTIWQKLYGCPYRRIAEVLDLVGLSHTGRKLAAQFSLGMKQRLGIAVAILHSPDLLILDEPTNGLDPNGILEIRELLQRLNEDEGATILVSSHLLSEIEKLASHIGILHNGRLRFQGTLPELLERRRENSQIVFETNDDVRTRHILSELGVRSHLKAGKVTIPALENEHVAAVNRRLMSKGIDVFRIGKIETDLEGIFLDVVGGKQTAVGSGQSFFQL